MNYYDKQGRHLPTDTPEGQAQLDLLMDDFDYRCVGETTLPDGKRVSTVWLGYDVNQRSPGSPLIFETTVFPRAGDYNELAVAWYRTEAEAEAGHQRMVKRWGAA